MSDEAYQSVINRRIVFNMAKVHRKVIKTKYLYKPHSNAYHPANCPFKLPTQEMLEPELEDITRWPVYRIVRTLRPYASNIPMFKSVETQPPPPCAEFDEYTLAITNQTAFSESL